MAETFSADRFLGKSLYAKGDTDVYNVSGTAVRRVVKDKNLIGVISSWKVLPDGKILWFLESTYPSAAGFLANETVLNSGFANSTEVNNEIKEDIKKEEELKKAQAEMNKPFVDKLIDSGVYYAKWGIGIYTAIKLLEVILKNTQRKNG